MPKKSKTPAQHPYPLISVPQTVASGSTRNGLVTVFSSLPRCAAARLRTAPRSTSPPEPAALASRSPWPRRLRPRQDRREARPSWRAIPQPSRPVPPAVGSKHPQADLALVVASLDHSNPGRLPPAEVSVPVEEIDDDRRTQAQFLAPNPYPPTPAFSNCFRERLVALLLSCSTQKT